jgi:glycosyltransferase involved in cell wall biosynthesis
MPYVIWFAPTNTSHLAKGRDFLHELVRRGHEVRLLCLDSVHNRIHSTRAQIEASGFPFAVLPPCKFRPDRQGLWRGLQRGALVRNLRAFLRATPMDAIVVGADTGTVSLTLVQETRRRGIPGILVVDGVLPLPNPRYRVSLVERLHRIWMSVVWRGLGIGGRRGTSGVELVLTSDATTKEALLRRGLGKVRIEAVGSPEFDALAAVARRPIGADEDRQLRDRLGIPAGRPVIFFVHQGSLSPKETQALILNALPAIRQIGGTLLMKIHPRSEERTDVWRRWAAEEGISPEEVVFVRAECTTLEAARLCDVSIVLYSTVSFEVLLSGKPLVLVQYLNMPYELTFGRRYGAAIDVDEAKDLTSAIVGAATDTELRSRLLERAAVALAEELSGPDGKSADRIASLVIECIEGRRKSLSE